MTTTDALELTLELVRFGWTQNASARDGAGRATQVNAENACCFSLDGALQRATWPVHPFMHEDNDLPWQAAEEAAYRLAKVAGMNGEGNSWDYICEWNDARGRTKNQVEELIAETIASDEVYTLEAL